MIMLVILGLAGVLLASSFERWLPYFMSFFTAAAIPFFYIYVKGQFSLKHFTLTVGMMSIAGLALNMAITDRWMIVPVTAVLTFVIHMLVTKIK